MGKLVKAAMPEAKGRVDFENDLLQKTIMAEIIEEDLYVRVEKVWALGEKPPADSDDTAETDDMPLKQASSETDSEARVPKV